MPHVTTRLGRWFYSESGAPDGVTFVLLHGLFLDGSMWARQTGLLTAHGRVVALDGPGHGQSDVPPPFTLEDQADALIDAFGALTIDRAVVVGLSWGAMVALRVALAHPTRVRALALLGGTAEPEPFRDLVMYKAAVALGRHVRLPAIAARRLLLPSMLAPRTLREQPDLVDGIIKTMQAQPREGVARAARAIVERSRNLVSALPHIHVPTLVLCGRNDRTTPIGKSLRLAEGIAGARLSLLDDCGHISVLEQPDRVSEVLDTFARDILEIPT